MPTAKVRITAFRENYIRDEADFLRVFGDRLIARGFRFNRGKRGQYLPDPAISYQRDQQYLHLTQEPDGRVSPKNGMLQSLLVAVRNGQRDSLERLQGFLLAEGDDRAHVLMGMQESGPAGPDGAAVQMLAVDPRQGALELEAPIVSSQQMAEWQLRERCLLLFGVRQEDL